MDRQPRLFECGGQEPVARARNTHPQNSHDAAATVKVTKGQGIVLKLLDSGPGTSGDLYSRAQGQGIRISSSGVRSRLSELVKRGDVLEYPDAGKSEYGNKAAVYKLAGQ